MRLKRSILFIVVAFTSSLVSAAEIITVETIQLQGKAVLGGTVIPYKEVTLAAQVPGRVEYLAGEVGDAFESGDTLATIDDDELIAKRKALMAQLANADAALRNSYVQYDKELYSPRSESIGQMPGMGIPGMFDQMFTRNMGDMMGIGDSRADRHADLFTQTTGINQARASLDQVRSQLEEIDAAIRNARSIAPFSGVILGKMVEVGDTMQPGQPLMVFGHVKFLRIRAEVPASLVQYLKIGMFVPAYLDNAGSRVDARTAQIYPLADPTQHTVTVKFDLPKTVSGGPGMYAEVMIPNGEAPEEPTVVIPESAIIRSGSLPGVLVVRDGNRSVLRLIRLGSKMGKSHITVLSGLEPDEKIIDAPPPGASSGWMPGA